MEPSDFFDDARLAFPIIDFFSSSSSSSTSSSFPSSLPTRRGPQTRTDKKQTPTRAHILRPLDEEPSPRGHPIDGNPFAEAWSTTSMEGAWECPRCEVMNRRGDNKCRSCEFSRADPQPPPLPSHPPPHASSGWGPFAGGDFDFLAVERHQFPPRPVATSSGVTISSSPSPSPATSTSSTTSSALSTTSHSLFTTEKPVSKKKAPSPFHNVLTDEILQCSLCYEAMEIPPSSRTPKTLSVCLHTFCAQCLKNVIQAKKGTTLTCPTCRAQMPLPRNGVDGLGNNFTLIKLIELMRLENQRHASSPSDMCPKHVDEKLKLFCDTCELLICRDCIIFDHKDHTYEFVSAVIEKHRSSLKEWEQKGKTQIMELEKKTSRLTAKMDTLEAQEREGKQNISGVLESLISEMRTRAQSLTADVTKQTEPVRNRLRSQKTELFTHLEYLKRIQSTITKSLTEGSDVDLLRHKKAHIQDISKLLTKEFSLPEIDTNLQLVDISTIKKFIYKGPMLHPGFCQVRDLDLLVSSERLASFVIDAYDQEGKRIEKFIGSVPTPLLRYRLINSKSKQEEAITATTDIDVRTVIVHEGSWSISYQPPTIPFWGNTTMKLEVSLEGIPIQGSPFMIKVLSNA